ncbi:MAG: RluA family pseudouridine synthase [Myxococcota bacterium]
MTSATVHHTVSAAEAGGRLDKVLASLPGVGSRQRAREVLRSGKVSLNGELVGPEVGGQSVDQGMRIEVAWNRPGTNPRRVAAREALQRAQVSIVYEDADILVANKPVGLLTDAATRDQARNRDTLRKCIRTWLGTPDVWPAHRIDRDTSGVVAFAKTPRARQSLHDQWVARKPLRAYLVVVEGAFAPDAGRFADWMRWDRKGRHQRPVAAEAEGAWLAEADFEVVRRFGNRATQLEVRLVSGRRNQIRLHAQLAGHPLIGERAYRNPGTQPSVRFNRQALHAHRLGFLHPTDRREVSFEAPIPSDLASLLRRLSKKGIS